MVGENRQLVTNEPVEFEKEPVEVQDCRKTTDHSKEVYRIYPNLIKENRRMSTCNRLDFQTLGSQPVIPQNLSDHCIHRPRTGWFGTLGVEFTHVLYNCLKVDILL